MVEIVGISTAFAPVSLANRKPRKMAEATTAALSKGERAKKEHCDNCDVSGASDPRRREATGGGGASGGDGGADGGEALAMLRSRARLTDAAVVVARSVHRFATAPATHNDETASAVDLIVSTASSASARAMACSVVRCG
eukprot:843297-Pleurochrysis_carterae.AAC.2